MTDKTDQDRISTPYFKGSVKRIFHLPESMSPEDVHRLVTEDRLCVSADGKSVAVILSLDDRSVVVKHNLPDVPEAVFCSKAGCVDARLLHVRSDCLIVWGMPKGGLESCVFELSKSGLRRIQSISRIRQLQRFSHGFVLFGDSPGLTDEVVMTEHGTHEVNKIVSAASLSDGRYLFLEKIEEDHFQYLVGSSGFEDWASVELKNEEIIQMLRLQGNNVLLSRSGLFSVFRLFGPGKLSFELSRTWIGRIESMFVSPNEQSLAWIVRPEPFNKSLFGEIYLNGRKIHEGEFTCAGDMISWSPSGSVCGIFVRTHSDREGDKQQIITPFVHYTIPADHLMREFLVDDEGGIAATILDDGVYCLPSVAERRHNAGSLAWNLGVVNGEIGFNSVFSSCIMRTTDQTDET